jgi:hypothetical protein
MPAEPLPTNGAPRPISSAGRPRTYSACNPTAPAARNDCKGIAWLLDRGHVVAIDAAGADIVIEGGAKQRFYRKVNAPGIERPRNDCPGLPSVPALAGTTSRRDPQLAFRSAT